MAFRVFRAIFPDLVLGSLSTKTACLKHATGPINSLTLATIFSTNSFSVDFESKNNCFLFSN